MDISLFDYDLPPERIAQSPQPDRASARLLRLDRASGAVEHRTVRELPRILGAGDLMVFNDTAVVPARLDLRRRTGGHVRGLFLSETQDGRWLVLLNAKGRLRPGETLTVADHPEVMLTLARRVEAGQWEADVKSVIGNQGIGSQGPDASQVANSQAADYRSIFSLLSRIGQTPLPPYIRRQDDLPDDRAAYQTVYARRPGAVAAPTAGLHFTENLLAELRAAGIEPAWVTLHVGVGTFQPVRAEQVELHRMHGEWFDCPAESAAAVNAARAARRRVIAVGTTSVRVLESCFDDVTGTVRPRRGWTDLFIFPGYRFRTIDGLLTNFHLPRSTLLMLVCAFAGRERVLAAYRQAIEHGYRFYSYGDAMLIE